MKIHYLELFAATRDQALRILKRSFHQDCTWFVLDGDEVLGVLGLTRPNGEHFLHFTWVVLLEEFGWMGPSGVLPGSASGNGLNGLAGEICASTPLPATAAMAAPASPPATNTPAANLQPAAVNSVDCIDKAAFVADVTIPDNTLLKKNTEITKTRRIKNASTCTWADGYQLTFTIFHCFPLDKFAKIS